MRTSKAKRGGFKHARKIKRGERCGVCGSRDTFALPNQPKQIHCLPCLAKDMMGAYFGGMEAGIAGALEFLDGGLLGKGTTDTAGRAAARNGHCPK